MENACECVCVCVCICVCVYEEVLEQIVAGNGSSRRVFELCLSQEPPSLPWGPECKLCVEGLAKR